MQHVQLGQAVGDRGAGEERPAAAGRVAAAQPPQLEGQVGGALGRLDAEALHAGREPEPLEVVGLVDQQVVDAELLEGHPVVGAVLQQLALAGLQPVGLLGDLLDGAAGPLLVLAQGHGGLAVQLDLGGQPGGLGVGVDGQGGERRVGDDDHVPVAGGAAGREPLAALPGEVVLGDHEDVGAGEQPLAVAGDLLQQVVGAGDQRLGGQAEPAQGDRATGTSPRSCRHRRRTRTAPPGWPRSGRRCRAGSR